MQVFTKYCSCCTFTICQVFSGSFESVNYVNLVPSLRMEIYEDLQIHTNTGSWPIRFLIPGGGTPILGHIRGVRPEWVSFPGRKPADGCKFLTKNLRMGHNFDTILPGNGWFPLN